MFDLISNIPTGIDLFKRITRQVPYANMLTVNNLAVMAQEDTTKRLLPKKFTLRTKWFQPRTKFGFNIKFATKETQTATMGSQADWLKLQEEGGTKTPTKSKSLSLPTEAAQPNLDMVIAKRDRPKALFASGKAFVLNTAKGKVIFMRTRKDTKAKIGSIVPMYLLEKQGRVRARFNFVEEETQLVNSNYEKVYNQAFIKALETAFH